MGLNLAVGILADLNEGDPEGADQVRDEIDAINRYLKTIGLPKHVEPVDCPVGGAEMYGYSGLHYLRRIAAYIELRGTLPPPGEDTASKDSVMEEYYSQLEEPSITFFSRLFGKKKEKKESPKRTFDHLMLHSDAEGYYLPIDFEDVLFPPDEFKIPGGMIGSSIKLLEECKRLANHLELPLDMDQESDELWEASDSQGEGDLKWQRYGIESFTCLRLHNAALHSTKHNSLILFT